MLLKSKKLSEKFAQIPVDADTRLLKPRREIKLNGIDALHERWSYEGVKAQSYIFCNEDIEGISQEEIVALIDEQKYTYSKGEHYTFLNFDFVIV